jgi:hypothetical protein
VKGYFDDDETHEWASVPLPADWTRTYGAGTLTVCWRDQGWGSQKGCLWGRLVRRGGAALPWALISSNLAPQRWTVESFALPASWFTADDGAAALELGFVVGGKDDGTGHQLQVQEGGQLVLEPRQEAAGTTTTAAARAVSVT